MLVSLSDLQADKFIKEVHYIQYTTQLQPDNNSLYALIRACVTSPPAHPFLITQKLWINVTQYGFFSETSGHVYSIMKSVPITQSQ